MKETTTIEFSHEETIYFLHPEESAIVTYLGRADVTIEKMMRDEGAGESIQVEFTHLWVGVDVPTLWHDGHFRTAKLPDDSQGFAKLRNELETAAIDQFYSHRKVTLPDAPLLPFEQGCVKMEGNFNLSAHKILGENPMQSYT